MGAGEMVRRLTLEEQETSVISTDADELVNIWTAQPRYIARLREQSSFTEIASGFYGTSEWAEFTIGAKDWNPATGAKRKLTDE